MAKEADPGIEANFEFRRDHVFRFYRKGKVRAEVRAVRPNRLYFSGKRIFWRKERSEQLDWLQYVVEFLRFEAEEGGEE